MKRVLPWLLVAAQVGVLAYMAGEREWILREGKRVWLRTAPIDPRDPMRGDYVRLNYETGFVPWARCRGSVADLVKANEDYRAQRRLRDRVVYAELAMDADGLASVAALHDTPPEGKPFMRGRVERTDARGITVRYGIEALFTEQGVAQKMEDAMRTEKDGVPLRVQAALGRNGLAVMRRHEWENLGLTLELDRLEPPPASDPANGTSPARAQRERPLVGAWAVLKNHGAEPLSVVVRADGSSWRLVANEVRGNDRWRWVREMETPGPRLVESTEVRVLQPGESLRERIDFTTDAWRVIDMKDTTQPARTLAQLNDQWSAWFRIEYAAPSADECSGLRASDMIWRGRLVSRSFTPAGGWD